ncbi:MAG: dicarboxylate/amino acid:cation symporter, partial [Flavobacterium sp.]
MKLKLHWKIALGMVFGLLFGYLMKVLEYKGFVTDWVQPFGTIFINLLKMIAVPLIVVSLIVGLAELKDIAKLSKLGLRTIGFYLLSTVVAVTIGLVLANVIQPGKFINEESRISLLENFASDAGQKIELAEKAKDKGPLQPLVDIVPDNFFKSLSDNGSMLQVILFVILLGIGLILIEEEKSKPVVQFFKGLNEVIMKIIDLIMKTAPYGVFALMAALMVDIPDFSTLGALAMYAFTVVLGLMLMVFVFYPTLLLTYAKVSPKRFFKAIAPAQLLAFSTSS